MLKNYPRMIQATKTEHTPFEEFAEKRIRVVNDAWTLPLNTWRWVTLYSTKGRMWATTAYDIW